MNQIISLSRLRPFVSYKLALNYKTWIIQLLAFVGIFTLFSGLFMKQTSGTTFGFTGFYFSFYLITLFACGMYITSRSFQELSGTNRGFLFMQLPVSVFEKFTIPALCTTLLFPLLFTGFYVLVARFSNLIWSNIFNFEYSAYPLFYEEHISAIRMYLIIQPLFLLGSIQFKRQHLLWSAISLTVILTVFSVIWLGINDAVNPDHMNDYSLFGTGIQINKQSMNNSDLLIGLSIILSWTVGYFKLKEREV